MPHLGKDAQQKEAKWTEVVLTVVLAQCKPRVIDDREIKGRFKTLLQHATIGDWTTIDRGGHFLSTLPRCFLIISGKPEQYLDRKNKSENLHGLLQEFRKLDPAARKALIAGRASGLRMEVEGHFHIIRY